MVKSLQMVAAFAICINHLTFSLIPNVELSHFWANQPTLWGIAFLAFSTGYLTEIELTGESKDIHPVVFCMGRFIRLAVPTYFAVALDLAFFSERPPGYSTWWPMLSVATLSQTWSYNVFGASSLPLPIGASNLVWVGSCLFGLTIIHACTLPFWRRLGSRGATAMAVVSALFCWLFFVLIFVNQAQLIEWGFARYGRLLPPYEFVNWLLLYNPLAEAGHYFLGVSLAHRLHRHGDAGRFFSQLRWMMLAVVILATSPISFPMYLAINIFVLLGVLAFAGRVCAPLSQKYVALPSISHLSYEVIVFHIMIYDVYSRIFPSAFFGFWMLVGRVMLANVVMLVVLAIGFRVLIRPSLAVAQRLAGVKPIASYHI